MRPSQTPCPLPPLPPPSCCLPSLPDLSATCILPYVPNRLHYSEKHHAWKRIKICRKSFLRGVSRWYAHLYYAMMCGNPKCYTIAFCKGIVCNLGELSVCWQVFDEQSSNTLMSAFARRLLAGLSWALRLERGKEVRKRQKELMHKKKTANLVLYKGIKICLTAIMTLHTLLTCTENQVPLPLMLCSLSLWICPLFYSSLIPRCTSCPPCFLLSVSLHLGRSEASIHQREVLLKSHAAHHCHLPHSAFAYKHISAHLHVKGTGKTAAHCHILCPTMITNLCSINMGNEI